MNQKDFAEKRNELLLKMDSLEAEKKNIEFELEEMKDGIIVERDAVMRGIRIIKKNIAYVEDKWVDEILIPDKVLHEGVIKIDGYGGN